MTTPTWYGFVLIALAAYRTTRLVGWDTITQRPRAYVTGWRDDGNPTSRRGRQDRRALRVWLSCPWCAGLWHCAAWWGAYQAYPHFVLVVAVPFGLNTVTGLATRRLDA